METEIAETRDLNRRLGPAIERLEERLARTIGLLPLLAVAILAAGLLIFAGVLAARARWPWDRLAPNPFIAEILRQVVRLVFTVAGLVLALDILGATALIGTLLGAAGLVGLTVGFAVRDTVENFIASIMLSLRQPFRPNDLVEIEGDMGKVVRLTSRATILLSLDGNQIRLPNATVFKSRIVNYTRNSERRFVFEIGVEADSDLEAVRSMVDATLTGLDFVLVDPPPAVWIEAINETGVVLTVTGWIDQHETDFLVARGAALRQVKDAIEAAGVTIPDTTYRIRLDGLLPGATAPPAPARTAPPPDRRPPPDALAAEDVAQPDNAALSRLVEAERSAHVAADEGRDLLREDAPKE